MERMIYSVLVMAMAAGTASAGTISWQSATDIGGATDVVASGSVVQAVNGAGAGGPTVVNGVSFTHGSSLGGTAAGLFTTTTGNAGYDTLLDTVDFGGGMSTSISVGGGSLVIGETYRVQVWFTDDRNAASAARIMTYGDGNGNTVDVHASQTDAVGAPGQFAVGTFIATGTSQTLALTTTAGNFHINAYQVRDGNLVTNGSFEPDGEFDFVPDNWNVTGQVFNGANDRSNIQTRDPNGEATDGDTLLQLNGGNLAPGGGIDQDLATIAGHRYELTFDWGKNGGAAGNMALDIDVTNGAGITGTSLLDETVLDASDNGLSSFSFFFTATSSVTNLRFVDSTTGTPDSRDGHLDNISVVEQVPAPAALPAGLAMLGLAAARRRRK